MQKIKSIEASAENPFLRALSGKAGKSVPFWLMRQAGRYLPEYRAVREKAGGFLELAFTPELAAEVTLQPLRRYGMDAAILFSDILTVPLALGRRVEFAAGEGPVLDPLREKDDPPVFAEGKFDSVMAPVYETVERVATGLRAEKFGDAALIGFAGAPWTVACYMAEGGGSRDFARVRKMARENPGYFSQVIDVLSESTAHYLKKQIAAGAEAVQLFDSWAGALEPDDFRRWCIGPAKKIVHEINAAYPHAPVIGFPRGAGSLYGAYARETGVSAISLDQSVSLDDAKNLQKSVCVQGNLDPEILLRGGDELRAAAEKILDALGDGPFVFNLGHGVIKETPPENVALLARIIRGWKP